MPEQNMTHAQMQPQSEKVFRSYDEFKTAYFPETTAQEIYTLEPTEFGREIARRAIHKAMTSNVDQQGLQAALLSDTMQIT